MLDDAPAIDLEWLDAETALWVAGGVLVAIVVVWLWHRLDVYLEDIKW